MNKALLGYKLNNEIIFGEFDTRKILIWSLIIQIVNIEHWDSFSQNFQWGKIDFKFSKKFFIKINVEYSGTRRGELQKTWLFMQDSSVSKIIVSSGVWSKPR